MRNIKERVGVKVGDVAQVAVATSAVDLHIMLKGNITFTTLFLTGVSYIFIVFKRNSS